MKKPYFTGDEFNLTMTRGKANKSLAVRDEAVSNTLAQLDLTDDDSIIVTEKMKKRREILEKNKARLKEATNWDFSGIEPPSPKNTSEKETDPETLRQYPTLEFSIFEETRLARSNMSISSKKDGSTSTADEPIVVFNPERNELPVDVEGKSQDEETSDLAVIEEQEVDFYPEFESTRLFDGDPLCTGTMETFTDEPPSRRRPSRNRRKPKFLNIVPGEKKYGEVPAQAVPSPVEGVATPDYYNPTQAEAEAIERVRYK